MKLQADSDFDFDPAPRPFHLDRLTGKGGAWEQKICCGVCRSDAVRLLADPTVEVKGLRHVLVRVWFQCDDNHISTISLNCGPSAVWIGSHWAGSGIPNELAEMEECSGH